MEITGQAVKHKIYGSGKIIEFNRNDNRRYIIVRFAIGEKEFPYPSCFEKFLLAESADFKNFVEEELHAFILEQENERVMQEIERDKRAAHYEEIRRSNTRRVHSRGNIAFKCSFCDGGASTSQVGFCNICSDENIKNNILKEKHTWCSSDSYCKAYLNGEITREELQARFDEDNTAVCYESNLLRAWCYEAGLVVNGINKGKPRTIKQIQNNSLCVLTTQKDSASDRQIFGVFIVSRSAEGNEFSAGRVEAHYKYRLSLTPQEAGLMKFWDYHRNKSEKAPYKWGQGLFRYLDDNVCIKILKDIVNIKRGTADEQLAVEFLNYYCTINKLEID